MSFHERRKSGEVVSRFTNDVSLVQNSLINGAADLVSQAAILVGAVLMLFVMNWRLSALILVMIPLVTAVMGRLGHSVRSFTSMVQA